MARPAKKKIAVVLATRNRSALLEKALDSLLEQTLAARQFEVAVIDNASTDDTRAVFDRIEERFGDLSLSYHYESNLGISFGPDRRTSGCQKSHWRVPHRAGRPSRKVRCGRLCG